MFFIPDSFIDGLVGEDLHVLDATTKAMGIGDIKGTVECFPKRECVVVGAAEAGSVEEARLSKFKFAPDECGIQHLNWLFTKSSK